MNAPMDVSFDPLLQFQYDAGSPFEAVFQFKNETFDIWMNNSRIRQQYNTTVGFGVVNYVQVYK